MPRSPRRRRPAQGPLPLRASPSPWERGDAGPDALRSAARRAGWLRPAGHCSGPGPPRTTAGAPSFRPVEEQFPSLCLTLLGPPVLSPLPSPTLRPSQQVHCAPSPDAGS